ncbi:hypothetical protein ACOME3_001566 [Neoechinorhynchus agilis]
MKVTLGIGAEYDKRLFQKPERFHLTLCPLCVTNNDSDELAEIEDHIGRVIKEVQTELDWNVDNDEKSEISICGLDYMNSDPGEVHVLYGIVSEKPVKGRLRIQVLAEAISDRFADLGYRKSQSQSSPEGVKLHATVMNSSFAVRGEDGLGKRLAFDARNILQTFGGFDFGKVKVDKIFLVERQSFDESGFYKTIRAFDI